MAKDNSVEVKVKLDASALIPVLEIVRDHQREGLEATEKLIAKIQGGEKIEQIPDIYIIDSSAIPVEYFLRESVLDQVKVEIGKDYKATKRLPAGASFKNEVEARSGETQETSDKKNDDLEPGTGSEDPQGGGDNGSGAGGSDSDTSGLPGESDRERGSKSNKGPRE